jgi:hypothetical protein
MTKDPTGVDRAIDAAGGGPEAYKTLAAMLGVSVNFIYLSQRRGYFPPERARIISDAYGIELIDLVSAKLRPLLNS